MCGIHQDGSRNGPRPNCARGTLVDAYVSELSARTRHAAAADSDGFCAADLANSHLVCLKPPEPGIACGARGHVNGVDTGGEDWRWARSSSRESVKQQTARVQALGFQINFDARAGRRRNVILCCRITETAFFGLIVTGFTDLSRLLQIFFGCCTCLRS